jgi:DNA-binding transcriptional LysR family regulator
MIWRDYLTKTNFIMTTIIRRHSRLSPPSDQSRNDAVRNAALLVEAGLGIALLSESNAAEELQHGSISTIGVGDLKASHDVVTVTRRGGFLSVASQRLLEIVGGEYRKARKANGE